LPIEPGPVTRNQEIRTVHKLLPVAGLSLVAFVATSSAARAATITVNAGGNLQAALDAAKPGDTILLQAGAVFTGSYKLPAKGGVAYITIRSSAADASLPPSGTRITPESAPLLAKIRSTNGGAAFRTASDASYWRLLFLEIYPSTATSSANLVELGAAGSSQSTLATVPQHFIVDRCYLHGDPGFGQRRGIALNSGEAMIVNSHFSDFKGINQDTQAIAGWNGPGPFLIENNHIEAAAENILFGGSDPAIPQLVPTGIRIRHNLITKPVAWLTQSWTVKNLVEFKNAQDVVVEGNTIENNWAAGQQGYAICLTPRNQNNTAPSTVVRNITVQNNIVRHVAAGFNILGYDDVWPSQQTQDITIRNNLIYDVSTAWAAPGQFANGWFTLIGAGPKNITIDHNTVDNTGSSTLFFYGGKTPTGVQILGFTVTNNLLRAAQYGIAGDNVGQGSIALAHYAPGAILLRNTFAGASAKLYPAGNEYPTLTTWLADFLNPGSAANYQLHANSASKHAATDGKDMGVDFAELNVAMKGASSPLPPITAPSNLVVYRPSNGLWYSLQSSTNFTTSTAQQWGVSTDVPVPGDYDGDGATDVAVYRPSTGTWLIVQSSTGTVAQRMWGAVGDVPVPGDYDGDGKTDIAVFRPSTGTWYIVPTSTSVPIAAVWGAPGDVPVARDYDGDRRTDIAIYRPSTGVWYIFRSATATGITYAWGGSADDRPVPGDYDGDGRADVAVFRPSTGMWYVLRSQTGTGVIATWGIMGDLPVPGDYDGDGRTDIAIYRPANGVWYIIKSSTNTAITYQWGVSGDVPVI
jgi:hypothetical protein